LEEQSYELPTTNYELKTNLVNLMKIMVQTSYYSLTGIFNKEIQRTRISIPLGMQPIQ